MRVEFGLSMPKLLIALSGCALLSLGAVLFFGDTPEKLKLESIDQGRDEADKAPYYQDESAPQQEQRSLVPLEKSLSFTTPYDNKLPEEKTLSEEELKAEIALAKSRLAEVEEHNQTKLKKMEDLVANEEDAHQSLLEVELAYVIQNWQQAWINSDADKFLSFYSPTFRPKGASSVVSDNLADEWTVALIDSLNTDPDTTVSLRDVKVDHESETQRSSIRFVQRIQSAGKERRVDKHLILEKIDDAWLIVAER